MAVVATAARGIISIFRLLTEITRGMELSVIIVIFDRSAFFLDIRNAHVATIGTTIDKNLKYGLKLLGIVVPTKKMAPINPKNTMNLTSRKKTSGRLVNTIVTFSTAIHEIRWLRTLRPAKAQASGKRIPPIMYNTIFFMVFYQSKFRPGAYFSMRKRDTF